MDMMMAFEVAVASRLFELRVCVRVRDELICCPENSFVCFLAVTSLMLGLWLLHIRHILAPYP